MTEETVVQRSPAPRFQAGTLCGRCGEKEATIEFGGLIAHGGGTPYCERCVVEVQLEHAIERAAQVPNLRDRLAEQGGPAERIICGYAAWRMEGDDFPFGALCVADWGHSGKHVPAK